MTKYSLPTLSDTKVSLEPYREASRRIMPIFEQFGLTAVFANSNQAKRVVFNFVGVCEKGGIDEVYLDVTERARNLGNEESDPDVLAEVAGTHVVGESVRLDAWQPTCSRDEALLVHCPGRT